MSQESTITLATVPPVVALVVLLFITIGLTFEEDQKTVLILQLLNLQSIVDPKTWTGQANDVPVPLISISLKIIPIALFKRTV